MPFNFLLLKIKTYYWNIWSCLQTNQLSDLVCIFQKIKLCIQNIPSMVMMIQYLPIMKTKENLDLIKYFASPELCQYFGSLLLNMYTVNMTPYF